VKSVVVTAPSVVTTDFTYTGLTLHRLACTQVQGEVTLASWSVTYLYDEYGKAYAGLYEDQDTSEPVFFALVTTDRGDVVELLDASGQAFAAYRYDAWGNPLGEGNVGAGIWAQETTEGESVIISEALAATISQRQVLRYAGYCYDAESRLYYLSARHYDPVTRQFLSKDLSRNDGEQSAYGYCLGNPVGNVDPSGYAAVVGGGWGARELHTHLVAESLRKSKRRLVDGTYCSVGMSAYNAFTLARNVVDVGWYDDYLSEMIYGGLESYGRHKLNPPRGYRGPDPATCIIVQNGIVIEPMDNLMNYANRTAGVTLSSTLTREVSVRNKDGSTRVEEQIAGRSLGAKEYASLAFGAALSLVVRDQGIGDQLGEYFDSMIGGTDWTTTGPIVLDTRTWED
jgi:RHS repeat-associated protein